MRNIKHDDIKRIDETTNCYTFRIVNNETSVFYKLVIYGICSFIFICPGWIIIFLIYTDLYGKRKKAGKLCGGVVKKEDVILNRENFENYELEKAYASLYYCTQISTTKLKNGIIGAYILKWYNNINIENKGNKVYILDLKDGNFQKSKLEQDLYDLLKEAAGNNNIIDNTEFKKWSRRNKGIIKRWYEKLLTNGYNDNLREDAKRLLGLKKFLLDYSLMEEKQHIEVKTWGNYLIYAQLLGISIEANKQFAEIYPDFGKVGQLTVRNAHSLTIGLEISRFIFRLFVVYMVLFIIFILYIFL